RDSGAVRAERDVVHPHRLGPGRAVVGGGAEVDFGVVVLIDRLFGVDHIHPVVIGPAGGVPDQPGLGVNGAGRLGRNVVEAADVGTRHQNLRAEAARAQPVGVHIDIDVGWTLPAGWVHVCDHDLAAVGAGADGYV